MFAFKFYKCPRCGFKNFHISTPVLSDKRNIISDNCPECFFGSMIIDFDDIENFNDNFIEKYYGSMLQILGEGGFNANF